MTGKQPGSPTPYDIEDTDELLKLDLRALPGGSFAFIELAVFLLVAAKAL